jgi:2-polyprenyl-3-methyl-5-hydroxy-6-metoxy-1,4-benzoquinol methylase
MGGSERMNLGGNGRGAEADTRSEELEEAERHDALYRDRQTEKLRLKTADWSKFDSIGEPLNAYYASMLRLGNVSGLSVLDAGCGDGWLSTILAKRGAVVDGFDISPEGVKTAQMRASVNGVADRCTFATASFYSLPYADESFDAIIGQAILHHLRNKEVAAMELFRIMKPGARAIFVEPLGNSAVLERFRLLVPVPSAAPEDPTEWKRQFKYSDIETFAVHLEVQAAEEYQLFSRLDRVLKSRVTLDTIARLDRRLLKWMPFLRRYARSIVLEFSRPVA